MKRSVLGSVLAVASVGLVTTLGYLGVKHATVVSDTSPSDSKSPATLMTPPGALPVLPGAAAKEDDPERRGLQFDLKSANKATVAAAIVTIGDEVTRPKNPRQGYLNLLLDAGLLNEAEAVCVRGMIANRAYAPEVANFAHKRMHCLVVKKDYAKALSAAKAYYNVCPPDRWRYAVGLLSLRLAEAFPNDPDIVERFHRQQLAGAFATTAPSETSAPGATTAPSPTENLGPSILASIKIDPEPFRDMIGRMPGKNFGQLMAKANLLLVSDRANEAIDALTQAVELAPAEKKQNAYQRMACAIRARDGRSGAADAYLNEHAAPPVDAAADAPSRTPKPAFDALPFDATPLDPTPASGGMSVQARSQAIDQLLGLASLTPNQIPPTAAAEPALQAALTTWCDAARLGTTISQSDLNTLQTEVARSQLNPVTLLAISKCIDRTSKHDSLLVGSLAQRAVERVRQNPPPQAGQDEQRLEVLMAAKGIFWSCIDGGSRREFVPQQLSVCEELSKIKPGGNELFENARIGAYIGGAECLYLLNRNDEAIARLDQLTKENQLNPDQAVSTAWARGLALFELQRYAEAVPCFEQCANENGYDHQGDATCLVVLSQLRSGQVKETSEYARQVEERFSNSTFAMQVRLERDAAVRRSVHASGIQ